MKHTIQVWQANVPNFLSLKTLPDLSGFTMVYEKEVDTSVEQTVPPDSIDGIHQHLLAMCEQTFVETQDIGKFRSTSVGDFVRVIDTNGQASYGVANIGFVRLEFVPSERSDSAIAAD